MEEKKIETAEPTKAGDHDVGPPVARVREEDLEPHEGLRYIAILFKALAVLLLLMFVFELVIGFRHDGSAALGTLLVEGTRTIVYAGFLWGAGDLALMFIESNHDLRASRILLGRLNGKLDRLPGLEPGQPAGGLPDTHTERSGPRASRS
ncbi:MAG: hypothetical protein ABIS27_08340 [Longimicrobiales bacterium]